MTFHIFLAAQNNRKLPCKYKNNTNVNNKIVKLFNDNKIDLPTEKELNAFNVIFLSFEALHEFLRLVTQLSKSCYIDQLMHKYVPTSNYIFMKLVLKDGNFELHEEN
jgi:hypothetical protein